MDLIITAIDLVKGDIVVGGTLELAKGLSVEIIYSTKSWEKLKKRDGITSGSQRSGKDLRRFTVWQKKCKKGGC